jgi:hypothetical protein
MGDLEGLLFDFLDDETGGVDSFLLLPPSDFLTFFFFFSVSTGDLSAFLFEPRDLTSGELKTPFFFF